MVKKVTKISIIGASGFIGYRLYKYLIRFDNFEIKGTYNLNKKSYLERVDITNKKSLQSYLLRETPDFILWIAGNKNIKGCEGDYNFAYNINTKPIEYLVDIINNNYEIIKPKILFFSADYVFDGDSGDYRDNDRPNPMTNYGKTNLVAEKVLEKSVIDYKIIRTAAVMGKGGTFFDWLLKIINEEKEIGLYSNTYFSPTPIEFLNENIKNIIINYEKIESKIIHIVGEKSLSRYEFASKLAKLIKKTMLNFYPQEANIEFSLFQRNLSLIQSDFIRKNQKKNLWEYIKEEVENDTIH